MSNTEFVMVPRVPTDEMKEAADGLGFVFSHGDEECNGIISADMAEEIYQVMIDAKPAEQHQGEPVAWIVTDMNGDSYFAYDKQTSSDKPLFTRADPAEVERLREGITKHWKVVCDQRAELDTLRAQLAERDALLRDNSGKLIRMAAHLISAPLFALQDLLDEDKKMTRARVDAAVESADARLKDAAYELRRIADALSASAEPSAPVEIDERAAFSTWTHEVVAAQVVDGACKKTQRRDLPGFHEKSALEGFLARAAMERKS
jgi:hypothetical protein